MSKLNDLIKECCPNGVDVYTLSDICSFQNGFSFKSNLFKNTGEKILRITNINDGKITEENCAYFNINDYKENLDSYKVCKGDVVVAMSGATTGKIGYNYSDSIYYLNQRVGLFRPNENKLSKRYLYYWLLSKSDEIYNISSGTGAQPNLSSIKMMNFKILVPPMKIQYKIVDILDKFSNNIELLKMEMSLREEQLNSIMQKLLDNNNFTTFKTLGEITNIEKGKTALQKSKSGIYPLVATTEYLQTSDSFQFDCEAVCLPLISARGHGVASITRIFYQSGKFALGNILCAIIPKDNNVKAEFLRHYLYYYKDFILVPLMKGGANVSLTIDSLKNVKVPIPSVEEQNNIIEIINKVSKILDKNIGLPIEIEKRQKQYEYYRDLLLNFKEVQENV